MKRVMSYRIDAPCVNTTDHSAPSSPKSPFNGKAPRPREFSEILGEGDDT